MPPRRHGARGRVRRRGTPRSDPADPIHGARARRSTTHRRRRPRSNAHVGRLGATMDEKAEPARGVVPIPERGHVGLTTYDSKDPDTSFPPISPVRPTAGAPNVLIIMIDDCGFGASSTFGGPCNTPNLDRLANNGLKFNRFHTTALCSPTRASLLTGRN